MGQPGEVFINLVIPPLVAVVFGFIASGIGGYLVGPFKGPHGKKAPLVESFALGTLAIALLTLLWSLLGWLGPSARWSLALPLLLVGIAGLIQTRPTLALKPASFRNRTIITLGLVIVVAVLLRIILSPMVPPVDIDECRTHLPVAKSILDTGKMGFSPAISYGSYPQTAEMLYLWSIAFGPFTSSHYLNFLGYIFCLLAIVRLGRLVFSIKIGWLAALIMASLGVIQLAAGRATPDIWLVFYILAGTLAMVEGLKEDRPGYIILSGLLLGGAAGVSYTGLLASVCLVISLVAIGRGAWGNNPVPRWAIFGAVILFFLVSMPWYVRNIFWFLNPFFPFYSSIFRPGGGFYGVYGAECAIKSGWILQSELVSAYFSSGELWQEILGRWSTWVGIPAGIWFWRSSPFVRAGLTWILLIWAFWMTLGGATLHFQYYIFLVPVNILLVAHLMGFLYSLLPGDHRGRFVRIILWVLLIGWIGIAGARESKINPPLTIDQQVQTLSSYHGSYDLVNAANQVIPEDRRAVGILCEDGKLYADFTLLGGGDVGWANHRVISDSCTSPETLAALLHERYNSGYLLVQETRLAEQDSPVFTPIKTLIKSDEFPRTFRVVARVGQGVVYFVERPE